VEDLVDVSKKNLSQERKHRFVPCVRSAGVIFIAAWVLASCANRGQPPTAAPGVDLPTQLAQIRGEYRWDSKLDRYVYTETLALAAAVDAYDPHSAVATLVGCLDDTAETRSTLDLKPVAIGVVCYEALSVLAYYEPTDSSGDVASGWPGHITPTATAGQLVAAKKAWTLVLEQQMYILL
jgi:hypothetical protein